MRVGENAKAARERRVNSEPALRMTQQTLAQIVSFYEEEYEILKRMYAKYKTTEDQARQVQKFWSTVDEDITSLGSKKPLHSCSTLQQLLVYLSAFALEFSADNAAAMRDILTRMVFELASMWLQDGEPTHPMLTAVLCKCQRHILISKICQDAHMQEGVFLDNIGKAPNLCLGLEVVCQDKRCLKTSNNVCLSLQHEISALASMRIWTKDGGLDIIPTSDDELQIMEARVPIVKKQKCTEMFQQIDDSVQATQRSVEGQSIIRNKPIKPVPGCPLTERAIELNAEACIKSTAIVLSSSQKFATAQCHASSLVEELYSELKGVLLPVGMPVNADIWEHSRPGQSSSAAGGAASRTQRSRSPNPRGEGASTSRQRHSHAA